MTHTRGEGNEQVHKLAWDAFVAGTAVAKSQGLYGAGQDLLKDAFSGNVHGMGPAVTEMEFEERPGEPFLFFAADKTDPGAYNLPLYLAFADAMNTPGLMLSPKLAKGFMFRIMDVNYTEGDRVIELSAPEDLYDIATLLRDAERFVVESVWSRAAGTQAVSVATSRLHNIAGTYTGKDDPVMLVRTQMDFPAPGEVLQPSHRTFRGRLHARVAQHADHAGQTQLHDQLVRRPADRELRGVLHSRGQADRSGGRFRSSSLGPGAGPCGRQGHGHAASGIFRRRNAADERTGVHRHHGKT
jgi:fructose 1,6-bisphosphatase